MSRKINYEQKYLKLLKKIESLIESFKFNYKKEYLDINTKNLFKKPENIIYILVSSTPTLYEYFKNHNIKVLFKNKAIMTHLKGFWNDIANKYIVDDNLIQESYNWDEVEEIYFTKDYKEKIEKEFFRYANSVIKRDVIKNMLENKNWERVLYQCFENALISYKDIHLITNKQDRSLIFILFSAMQSILKNILKQINDLGNANIVLYSFYRDFISSFVNELHNNDLHFVVWYLDTIFGVRKVRKIYETFDGLVLELIQHLFEFDYDKFKHKFKDFDFHHYLTKKNEEIYLPLLKSKSKKNSSKKTSVKNKQK